AHPAESDESNFSGGHKGENLSQIGALHSPDQAKARPVFRGIAIKSAQTVRRTGFLFQSSYNPNPEGHE
ncbi:MAG: hypothetical protein ACKO40_10810, partial [Planctomycetaceae bacterium]